VGTFVGPFALAERTAQHHFIDFCELLHLPRPATDQTGYSVLIFPDETASSERLSK
jgi:hypothetical protein